MQLQELNTGVIFTNSNCIGCNKCISGCIALGANVVVKAPDEDSYTVMVDPNKCILCGICIAQCVHKARTYRDDTDAFFDTLATGEPISLLVSSTLLTDYEGQYRNILGYLKELGVRHLYNTAVGGDLMAWVYMNLIHEYGLAGVISQNCPVIVNYLEKYKPELLEYLMPVQSPVMCTAIYVSDYLNNTDCLAYLSPCIATEYELHDVNTYGKVTYNVTFERLMERLKGIDLSQYSAVDEAEYGLGALISMPGGLTENIKQYIGFNEVLIEMGGPTNIFPYFDHYFTEVSAGGELPFLVDALSCTGGCNFGTGANCGIEVRNRMTFSAHRVKERAFQSGNVVRKGSPSERLEGLNKRFWEYALSSFVRQYDLTRCLPQTVLPEEEIEEIFCSMYKISEAHRRTDCGACGYQTCRAMAYAIGTNVNHKENCINYARECIRLETEKTHSLLAEISNMNEELRKSTQLKSNFLANMSHEIRTPMNAIIGMAEMALRGELGRDERGYIQQIKASGRSLLAIINDILDFSKIESGKMELNESEYKVMSIVNDTVNIVMTRIGEKNITLRVNADPNIPFALFGDDIRIKQVLVNFANNAVKFTESGCVELSLRHERREADLIDLIVSIRDTGIGIKEEDLAKLFNSFQQVDSKRNRNVEGTGLGLAISQEFVRLMNGEILVESVYGSGSTFSFRIPQRVVTDQPSIVLKQSGGVRTACLLANPFVRAGFLAAAVDLGLHNTPCTDFEALEEAYLDGAEYFFLDYPLWDARADAFARAHTDAQVVVIVDPRKDEITAPYIRKLNQPAYSLNIAAVINHEDVSAFQHEMHAETFRFEAPDAEILIVDDNAINLTVAKGLLSPLHMHMDTAAGAREAFALLAVKQYDIVFMDHMMPDIDGVEATHIIRAMEEGRYADLPIIALTANAINNAKEMFLREGMNDFVAKPIEMMDITSKLRKWLPPEMVKPLGESETPAAPAAPAFAIAGLDVAAGIALSGSEELYRAVLADYHAAIVKKSALIEQYEQQGDLPAYTIEVHALKSASRLIGAGELGELAARLEKCGNTGDTAVIAAETPALLTRYRALEPVLAPFGKQKQIVERVPVTLDALRDRLTALTGALDDFDLDAARELTDALGGYLFDDSGDATFARLREAVDAMEYDDAQTIATDWQAQLEPPA